MTVTATPTDSQPDTPVTHPDTMGVAPWYRRPSVLAFLLVVVLAYTFLWIGVDESTRYRPTMDAPTGTNFDLAYVWHLVPLMIRGLLATIKATVYGFTLAIALGLVFALLRRSRSRLVSWPAAVVIEFIRSTPILVQLVFLLELVRSWDWVTLRPIEVLALGLGIHYATYCSEGYRAGINSVEVGQWEASTALNLDPITKWTRVVLPQAIPNVLPALGNYLIAAFKDAPLGIAVNAPGIVLFANAIRDNQFRSVEPFLLIGVGFLAASLPAAWLVRRLERRIAYERT